MGCERRHRHRIQQISINIPLFVFLFVVLTQLFSITALAAAHDNRYAVHIDREKTSPSQQTVRVARNLKLHSRCSGRHVSVKGRQVQARAPQNNSYAWLRIETDSFESRVRIRSTATHYYLCFNETGRLTVKKSARGSRCLFTELHAANDYTEFQSVANPQWFLGFNKDGKRLVGDQWTRARNRTSARKCYQFIKTDFTPQRHTPTRGGRAGSDADAAGGRGVRLPMPLPSGAGSSSEAVEVGDWYTSTGRRGRGMQRRSSGDDRRRLLAKTDRRNKPPK